jgi:small nuclear ribonucleoprotein (snRNP)-like protein
LYAGCSGESTANGNSKMENGDSPPDTPLSNAGGPEDPSKFLGEIIGAEVVVKLNSGIIFRGTLQSVDGYMNIALEDCQEVDHTMVSVSLFVCGTKLTQNSHLHLPGL